MNTNNTFIGDGGTGKLAGNTAGHEGKSRASQQEPPRRESDAQQRETTENQRSHDSIPESATTRDASHLCFNPQNTVKKVLSGSHSTPDNEMTEKNDHCLPQNMGASQVSSERILQRPRIMWWPMLVLSLVFLTWGICSSFGGIVLPQLTQAASGDLFLTTLEASLFNSIYYLGGAVGTCLSWPLQTIVGQRIIAMLGLCLAAAAWVAISLTTSVWLLFVARIVHGITVCFLGISVTTYMIETAHKSSRGMQVGIINLCLSIGMLMPAMITAINLSWRQTAIVWCVVSLVPVVGMLLLPDSPRWLMTRGRDTDALKALTFFRGDSHEAESEYQDIAAQVIMEGQGGIRHQTRMLFRTPTRHTLGQLLLISTCYCFGGAVFIIAYLVPLLEMTNTITDSYQISIVCLALRLVGVILSLSLTDRLGRKPFVTVGSTNICVCYGMMSLYFFLQKIGISSISWLPTTAMAMILFSDGIAFTGYQTMEGELLPLSCRTIGVLLTTCARGISSLACTLPFETMATALGLDGLFLLYCAVAAVIPFTICFCLQETQGASLEDLAKNTLHVDNMMKKEQKSV